MIASYLSFKVTPSNPAMPVGLEVWVNQQQIFNAEALIEPVPIRYEFDDSIAAEYVLKVILKNKKSEHTRIDADNNILSDSLLELGDFELEGIAITQLVLEQADYKHNFNGHGVETTEKIYGTIGCNGILSLEFSTPLHNWLLEHM